MHIVTHSKFLTFEENRSFATLSPVNRPVFALYIHSIRFSLLPVGLAALVRVISE